MKIGKLATTGAKANLHIQLGSPLSVSNIKCNAVPPALTKDFVNDLQAGQADDANISRKNTFSATVQYVKLCKFPGHVEDSRGAPKQSTVLLKSENHPEPANGFDLHVINTRVVVRRGILVQIEDGKCLRTRYVDTLFLEMEHKEAIHVLYSITIVHESQGLMDVELILAGHRIERHM